MFNQLVEVGASECCERWPQPAHFVLRSGCRFLPRVPECIPLNLHEIFHVLGAVGASPNSDGNYGHIKNDPTDLMGGSQGTVRLDPGNNDYWRHGQSNYVDLYNSAFMEPAEPNAVMPAGW